MDKNDKMLSADTKQASFQCRITLDQVMLQISALQDSSAKLPNLEVRAAFVTYGSAARCIIVRGDVVPTQPDGTSPRGRRSRMIHQILCHVTHSPLSAAAVAKRRSTISSSR